MNMPSSHLQPSGPGETKDKALTETPDRESRRKRIAIAIGSIGSRFRSKDHSSEYTRPALDFHSAPRRIFATFRGTRSGNKKGDGDPHGINGTSVGEGFSTPSTPVRRRKSLGDFIGSISAKTKTFSIRDAAAAMTTTDGSLSKPMRFQMTTMDNSAFDTLSEFLHVAQLGSTEIDQPLVGLLSSPGSASCVEAAYKFCRGERGPFKRRYPLTKESQDNDIAASAANDHLIAESSGRHEGTETNKELTLDHSRITASSVDDSYQATNDQSEVRISREGTSQQTREDSSEQLDDSYPIGSSGVCAEMCSPLTDGRLFQTGVNERPEVCFTPDKSHHIWKLTETNRDPHIAKRYATPVEDPKLGTTIPGQTTLPAFNADADDEFNCETCGNIFYSGTRAFDMHLNLARLIEFHDGKASGSTDSRPFKHVTNTDMAKKIIILKSLGLTNVAPTQVAEDIVTDVGNSCEICGNFVYMGKKAFDEHFNENRHITSLKSLCSSIYGISDTTRFGKITGIEYACRLSCAILSERQSARNSKKLCRTTKSAIESATQKSAGVSKVRSPHVVSQLQDRRYVPKENESHTAMEETLKEPEKKPDEGGWTTEAEAQLRQCTESASDTTLMNAFIATHSKEANSAKDFGIKMESTAELHEILDQPALVSNKGKSQSVHHTKSIEDEFDPVWNGVTQAKARSFREVVNALPSNAEHHFLETSLACGQKYDECAAIAVPIPARRESYGSHYFHFESCARRALLELQETLKAESTNDCSRQVIPESVIRPTLFPEVAIRGGGIKHSSTDCVHHDDSESDEPMTRECLGDEFYDNMSRDIVFHGNEGLGPLLLENLSNFGARSMTQRIYTSQLNQKDSKEPDAASSETLENSSHDQKDMVTNEEPYEERDHEITHGFMFSKYRNLLCEVQTEEHGDQNIPNDVPKGANPLYIPQGRSFTNGPLVPPADRNPLLSTIRPYVSQEVMSMPLISRARSDADDSSTASTSVQGSVD